MIRTGSVCLTVFSIRAAEALLRSVLSYRKKRSPYLTSGDRGSKGRNRPETPHQALDGAPSVPSADF